MTSGTGVSFMIDLLGCSVASISDTQHVRATLLDAARKSGAHVFTDAFHTFNPYGVSGVVVTTEAHLAVHTWPEYGCVSVDVFTSGEGISAARVSELLFSGFEAKEIRCQSLERGMGVRLPGTVPNAIAVDE